MKCLPVVEIVQIDCIGGVSIGEAACGEDFLASFVFVLIAGDGGVELGDCGLVELGGVLGEKFLELDVGRFIFGYEGNKRVAIYAEGIENHHVVAGATVAVAVGEFSGSAERHFLPETWKVENTERAGCSRRDGRDGFVAHVVETVNFNSQLSTFNGERVLMRKAGIARWL